MTKEEAISQLRRILNNLKTVVNPNAVPRVVEFRNKSIEAIEVILREVEGNS